ncbi:hypothetical protein CO731_05053 [Aminobacter sp. MSH1]|nr:hypothetical protein CO731_04838 [Aminobacter sp. MSH1]AWC25555.1 hypothetical protein CO731_05053 [Aminobacter sp. MSH1]
MGKIFRFVLLGITSAFMAMFAEPFFSELLRRVGVDTSAWVQPAMALMSWATSTPWFQFLTVLFMGATIGAWLDWLLRKVDARSSDVRVVVAQRLASLGKDLETLGQFFDLNSPPSIAQLERYVDQVRSVEISVSKLGVTVPRISYEADPIGYIDRMRAYASRIAPLIADGHIAEAKRIGREISEKIRKEAPTLPTSQPKLTHRNHG